MSYFEADRLAAYDAERKALSKACRQAARGFYDLLHADIEASRSGSSYFFREENAGAPWAPWAEEHSKYAIDYGSCSLPSPGDKKITYYEDRFGDRFEFPVEFLTDPEGWAARYEQAKQRYVKDKAKADQQQEKEEQERQARYEREQYARLKAKFEAQEQS